MRTARKVLHACSAAEKTSINDADGPPTSAPAAGTHLLCRQKPLVKTQRPNRTDYTWFSLGYFIEPGEAIQRRLLSVLMLF